MVDLKSIRPQNYWYVAGLIVADGSLSKNGRYINITSKDREYLFSIREALGINVAVGKKSRGGQKEKKYSYLQFGDVKFYRHLLDIGLTPRKSLTLGKIKVDNKYFVDFLRGIIDGDGNISTWIHRTNRHHQWSLRITSAAPLFIEWLKEEIEKYFDVRGKLYSYLHEGKKNNIYILKFGKLAAKIIVDNIYYKNALCLSRKNEKKIAFLRDKNKMVNYGGVLGASAGIGRQPGLKIQ